MQKKKQRRVNFRINHCSSEDPQYPVTQLLLQSPDAKGWQSKRFSAYPQIIIIQLVEPTLLRQISFLSHQSKIASKIQIQTKLQENKDWKKLGYVSLTSNQNTNFQARQLRSANLNAIPSLLIKLTFRTNHVNSQNVFNQVGLISLSVYGDKMVQSNFNIPPSMTATQGQGQKSVGQTLQFDKQTMTKLKELEIRKKQAVDNQEFDLAKNIKEEIQRIKNIGQTLILLEQRKQQSVKKEDYETAKIINEQMKKMRDQNHWGPPTTNKPSGNPAQFYKKQKTQNTYQQEEQQQSVSPISNQQQRSKPSQQKAPLMNKKQPETKNPPPQQRAQKFDPQDRPLNNNNNGGNKKFQMDERPLDIKGNKGPSEYENQDQEKQGNGEAEPLNKQIHAECQPYFYIFDEQVFRCLFSKDHKNRQTGIKMLKDKLSQKVQDRQGLIQAMLYAIKCVIDDRIASVLISVLQLFDTFMRKLKPSANSNNLTYAQYIMEKICDYLGHTNQKIVNISQTIYSNLPVYQLTNKDVCYKCLTLVYKRQKPPKIQAGRLKMIGKVVSEYQLGKSYEQTVSYVIKYVDDKNNDVRTAAINTIVAISNQIGYSALQPFLKNVRPQIIKTIQEQMEGAEGDDRNYEEKPIRPNKGQNQPSKGGSRSRNQIQTVQNQFIQMPKNNNKQQNDDNKICPFCKKFDQRFVQQDYLDMHFFHSCPALTICLQCKQTIEISTLTSHLVGQCENSKYYKKCPRCKEAVHQKIYKTHVEKKECLSAKPLATANRCPLCHLDISPGVNGWKEHLVDEGCQNNPRK